MVFRLLAPLFLLACTELPVAGPAYIAPLDGQTLFPEDLELLVSTGGLDLPPDSPVDPDLVQVIDLDRGDEVAGDLTRLGHELRFAPRKGWESGHTYLWYVGDVPGAPRQPGQALPERITGQATFQVADGKAVLDAGIGADGAVCLVLSRPASELPDLEVTLMDEPVDGTWELRGEQGLGGGVRLLDGDLGVDLACWVDPPELVGGESLRVQWGDDGPWRFVLDAAEPEELTARLRRRPL